VLVVNVTAHIHDLHSVKAKGEAALPGRQPQLHRNRPANAVLT
jgi:hypothetical protein